MNGPQITIETRGTLAAVRDLRQLGVRAEDVRPAWKALSRIFMDDERRRFEREGPGWEQLASSTVENKRAHNQSPKILRATDTLFHSLTVAADGRSESKGDALLFGTKVEYAHFHQYGTTNMPKREVVGVSSSARREMDKVLSAFIARGET